MQQAGTVKLECYAGSVWPKCRGQSSSVLVSTLGPADPGKCPACHLPALGPWAGYSTSPCPGFSSYVVVRVSQGFWE